MRQNPVNLNRGDCFWSGGVAVLLSRRLWLTALQSTMKGQFVVVASVGVSRLALCWRAHVSICTTICVSCTEASHSCTSVDIQFHSSVHQKFLFKTAVHVFHLLVCFLAPCRAREVDWGTCMRVLSLPKSQAQVSSSSQRPWSVTSQTHGPFRSKN